MEVVYPVCCGLDVHKKILVCCLRDGKRTQIRQYGTSTCEIRSMVGWLRDSGCQMTVMESTGSYWKPVYNVFEAEGAPITVANARDVKNVPGRKTDKADAEWLSDLLRHGLVRPSFIPDRSQRELREALAFREKLVRFNAALANVFQKMLEGGNIKLSGALSDIMGPSAQTLLSELLEGRRLGEADIRRLQMERKVSTRLKATPAELAKSLDGVLTDMQTFALRMCLERMREVDSAREMLEEKILSSLDERQREVAERLTGIPGVGMISAVNIIAVIGTDMSRFPSARHLSSWAGVSPGNNESAGKRRSGRTTKGNALLKTTLVMCAQTASKVKGSFFSAQYSKLVKRRGANRAKMAVAHSMLIAIYHMIKNNEPFKDLGADYYIRGNVEKEVARHLSVLASLGFDLASGGFDVEMSPVQTGSYPSPL